MINPQRQYKKCLLIELEVLFSSMLKKQNVLKVVMLMSVGRKHWAGELCCL